MTGSFPSTVQSRRWPVVGFLLRVGRRTLVESLYLLTAPVIAVVGLPLVLGGLCVPGGLAPVRWISEVERWRIEKVRSTPVSPAVPRLWPGVAYAVAVLPLALVTFVVTALWWFVGVGAATSSLRYPSFDGPLRPMTLQAGSAESHIDFTLGLTSPSERVAFGTVLGLLLLCVLPLVTRMCVAAQTWLGRALLFDTSASLRARTAAEATALRRLERDIHDGPQQRLVRLAMELGRAQHHFDSRPEAVREALSDALTQTQEAMDELRTLSRGIAPPILVDRGLHAALTALADGSTVPAQLDADPVPRRLDVAAETAAYFVVAEALTNVAKHSYAGQCVIGLRHSAGSLRVWVTDDGVGGAALAKGHGLRGLDDRLHAVGGRLSLTSPDGGPTTITAELPC